MYLIGEIHDLPSQQTIPPVTLRVSGYDEGDKPMCVFSRRAPFGFLFSVFIFSARNGHHFPAVH
jgi:hypothetical protein